MSSSKQLLKTIFLSGVLQLMMLVTASGHVLAQDAADFAKIQLGEVPKASARTQISLNAYKNLTNMGDIASSFDAGLRSQKYEGQGWAFLGRDGGQDPNLPGTSARSTGNTHPPDLRPLKTTAEISGFSVVTQVEQYDPTNGKWLDQTKRFRISDTTDYNTIYDRVKLILFNAPVGHYRMFLFLVGINDRFARKQVAASTYIQWDEYFRHTYKTPMIGRLAELGTSGHDLDGICFVYEFERASADGELIFHNTPTLSAETHLNGSGLMQSLKLN